MKNKPIIFSIFFSAFILMALSFPLQIMLLYGHEWGEWPMIFSKLTVFNRLVIGIFLLNAYLSLTAHKWLRVTIPLSLLVVCANNFIVGSYGTDYALHLTSLTSLMYLFFVSNLYLSRGYQVLLNPQLRWWRVPLRKKISCPVSIKLSNGEYFKSKSFDISNSGLFLEKQSNQREDFSAMNNVEEILEQDMILNLAIAESFFCRAKIVRKTAGNGQYPAGIGLEFIDLNWQNKHSLQNLLQREVAGH